MTPFANYENFEACVLANTGRVSDPEGYCASIQNRTDHSNPDRQVVIASTFSEDGIEKFKTFYHSTPTQNVSSIMSTGLDPAFTKSKVPSTVSLSPTKMSGETIRGFFGHMLAGKPIGSTLNITTLKIVDPEVGSTLNHPSSDNVVPPSSITEEEQWVLTKSNRMNAGIDSPPAITVEKFSESGEPDQFAQFEIILQESDGGTKHKLVVNAPHNAPEWELLRLAQDTAQDLQLVPLQNITSLRFVSVRSLEVPFSEFLSFKESDPEKFEEWAFEVTMRRQFSGRTSHDIGDRIGGQPVAKGTRKQETVTFPLFFDWKPTDAELLSKGQEIATMLAGEDRWIIQRSILKPRPERSASRIRAEQKAEARRRMSQDTMGRRPGGRNSSRLTAQQLRDLRDNNFGEE